MSQFHLKFAFGCPDWLKPWFPDPWEPWAPALALLLALAACVWFVLHFHERIKPHLDRRYLLLLLSLRILAVAILLLFVFRPEISYLNRSREQPVLAVLVDVSRSMSIRDHPDIPGRLDQVKSVLRHPPSAVKGLFEVFEPRVFAFDTSPREVAPNEVAALEANGEGTFLTVSLKDACSAVGVNRIGGVLLFTDGADNSSSKPEEDLRDLDIPVHAVGVGTVMDQKSDIRDVRLADIESPKVVTVNQTAQIHAYVDAFGFQDRVVTVRLLQDGQELAQARIVLDGEPGPQKVTLSHTPKEIGRFRYTVEVEPLPSEQIEENNRRPCQWEVKDSPIKVLYVEGKPRPEFKFLKRILDQHESTEIMTLVQVGQGQFVQQGKVEGVEELLGFPRDKETLEKFDVIIFGSIRREHFSTPQLESVRDVVSNGAGVLMLGGYESLGSGGYGGTPIEDILPVRLGDEGVGQVKESFVPVLTREGKEHPIFAGTEDFFPTEQSKAKQQLPPLLGCNRTLDAKPGASILAVQPQSEPKSGLAIVAAAHSFGAGRSMVFTADSTWQWYLQLRGLGQESPYVKFWVQTCRWLAGRRTEEGPGQAGITAYLVEEMIDAGDSAILRAQVHDRQGLLTALASVSATIKSPASQTFHVKLPFLPGSRGLYESPFRPPMPGKYETSVQAVLDNEPLGEPVSLHLAVNLPRRELEDLGLNENLLRRIATVTGGRYVTLSHISELAEGLQRSERTRMAYRHYALWNAPGLFIAFVCLQTVEWVLRKRRHLA
jgi:uncharacterized membrane protein